MDFHHQGRPVRSMNITRLQLTQGMEILKKKKQIVHFLHQAMHTT
jgi:hypothetical protein